MPARLRFWSLIALACLCWPAPALAGKFNKVLSVGDAAPEFAELPGVDGQPHSLAEYESAKFVVVVFTANHCPFAMEYEDRLIGLQNDFAEQGVQVVALSCSLEEADNLEHMQVRAQEKGFNFPYLHDASQNSGRAYGASVTPQVFVLDDQRRVAYMGAIDDHVLLERVKHHYLRDALTALCAGETPAETETKAKGCGIEYRAAEDRAGAQTATDAAAPVELTEVERAAFDAVVAQHRGQVVLVDFWATWCGPCVKQFPHTVELSRQYAEQGLAVISVSFDEPEDADRVRSFLQKQGAAFTNLLSRHGASDSIELFGIDNGALPNYWLFNRAGELVQRFSPSDPTAEFEPADLDRAIESLLQTGS